MKKISIACSLLLALIMAQPGAKAQTQSVKGVNYAAAGIGIGTFGFNGTGGLPVTLSFDHGFTDKITGGLYVGMVRTKYLANYKYRYTIAGVRASYHFNEELKISNPKIDVYGGATLYYRGYTLKYKYTGDGIEYSEKLTGGSVGVGIHVGGHYFFTDQIGAYADLGYGISPLQLGLVLRF
jgi:hypothetical protein